MPRRPKGPPPPPFTLEITKRSAGALEFLPAYGTVAASPDYGPNWLLASEAVDSPIDTQALAFLRITDNSASPWARVGFYALWSSTDKRADGTTTPRVDRLRGPFATLEDMLYTGVGALILQSTSGKLWRLHRVAIHAPGWLPEPTETPRLAAPQQQLEEGR